MLTWPEYKKYLENRQLQPATITARKSDITQFLTCFSSLKQEEVDGFVEMLLEKEYDGKTIKRKIGSLRDFGKANGVHVVTKVPVPPAKRNLMKIHDVLMENGEFREILDKVMEKPDTSFDALRVKAVFLLLAHGLRRIGIINLTLAGVETGAASISFRAKWDRFRTVPIIFYKDILLEYRYAREARDYIDADNFIVYNYNNNFRQIEPRELYKIYYTALAEVTDRKINPHAWRHSVGTRLVDNGMPIDQVKDVLGHASINSTELYVHLSGERVRSGLERFHPAAGRKK